MKYVAILFLMICVWSCQDNVQPKPNAYLALNYPEPIYANTTGTCPYTFEVNKKMATIKPSKVAMHCWIDITYPKLNGTIYLTYMPVENNLTQLLTDAQNLPLQHTVKADEISPSIYANPEHKTYGTFYMVKGDAASQAQFYLTDSVKHFITGAVYFEAKPNFDSILPAAAYLQRDTRHIMETIRWK